MKQKMLFLIALLFLFTTIKATTLNTPVIDAAIAIAANDWDADEEFGPISASGSTQFYYYMTWDNNYIYFGFKGLNWSGNANDQIYGHFDVIAGGTTTSIDPSASTFVFEADFAYELIRTGSTTYARFYTWAGTDWSAPTDFSTSDLQYLTSGTYDTEIRISWSDFSGGSTSSGPTPFNGVAYDAHNNGETYTVPEGATDCDGGTTIGGFSFSGSMVGVSPVDLGTLECNPTEPTLPVELSSFTATNANNGVLLQWTTASETENLGFIVERKFSGSNWQKIADYKSDQALLGQGNVSHETQYQYIDASVQNDREYEYRLSDVDFDGNVTTHATRKIVAGNDSKNNIPEKYSLQANYPNPFNPSTTINYSSPEPGLVTITIYDVSGRQIKSLVNQHLTAGYHSIKWNSTDQAGNNVSAGIYFYNIQAGDFKQTKKMLLFK